MSKVVARRANGRPAHEMAGPRLRQSDIDAAREVRDQALEIGELDWWSGGSIALMGIAAIVCLFLLLSTVPQGASSGREPEAHPPHQSASAVGAGTHEGGAR